MIEKDVEAKICAKLATLGLADVQIVGTWQPTVEGSVKATTDADAKAVIAVSVAPRSYSTFTVPHCDLTCSVVVSVRRELCPTGAEIATYVSPVFALVHAWQMGGDSALAQFNTDDFTCVGFRTDGGTAPDFEPTANVWSVTQTFTLRGHVSE